MKILTLFSVLLLAALCVSSCAASKKTKQHTDSASTQATAVLTSHQDIDFLRIETDTLIFSAADSILGAFANDSIGVVRTIESGGMVLQIMHTPAGFVMVKAVAKSRTIPVKQTRTELKTQRADSAATDTRTAQKTEIKTWEERKALIPDWVWWIGLALLSGFAIYWIWYSVKK